ncbi:MAG: filamentous hemagglutinin N-terminal domain-containing protein [Candidatus Omnitrophota bacterium]
MSAKIFKLFAVGCIISLTCMPIHGYCLPEGEVVVDGAASFDRSQANTLNINQSTDKMIANYNSFSIAQPEAVHFNQPSSSSIALNRVVGVDPSSILGALTANGRIFLINPNGVLFGQGSRVDTAGLIASTLNISNADFMAGRYTFVGPGGSVVNQGYISAPGGFVSLLGSAVENSGIIEAELGSIALASGNATTLKLDPTGQISVVVDESTIANLDNKDAAVKNSGTLAAQGGKVILTAKTLDGVFSKAINNEGIIEANGLGVNNGQIIFEANNRVNVAGSLSAVGGNVTVNSKGADFSGTIHAAEGIYNMHGGDTVIDPLGSFSGDQSWYDDENIDVIGGIIVTDDGDIEIIADNDNDGSGDLTVTADITTQGGDIDLEGVNVSVDGAIIESIAESSKDVAINILGHSAGSEVTVNNSRVAAEVSDDGDASVDIAAAGAIRLLDSSVAALAHGAGDALISIDSLGSYEDAPEDILIQNSSVNAEVGKIGSARVGLLADGLVSILENSVVGADVLSNGESDSTSVVIDARDVDIDNSVLGANVHLGDGAASVTIDASVTLDILNSEFMTSVFGYSDNCGYEFTSGGQMNIEGTGMAAYVRDGGVGAINLSGNGIDIFSSNLIAEVIGEGEARVNMEADEESAINITDESSVKAHIGSGEETAKIALSAGAVSISGGSTLEAKVDTDGTAEIILESITGDIDVSDSDVRSLVNGDGLSLVELMSENNITIGEFSNVFAEGLSGVAAVLASANNDINADGAVYAYGNLGFGGVGLFARNDLYAGNVFAKGGFDSLGFLADEFNEFMYGKDDPTQYIAFDSLYNYGSLVLLASLEADVTLGNIGADAVIAAALGTGEAGSGSIFDAGTVSGHYLGLLARNDIGLADAPINTDVDIVSAYSYDSGSVYLNQTSRLIELGLYLPISVYENFGEEVLLGQMGLGASVAANDGIVHITSAGDMIVNSIVTPRGGVFLESANGSIYAGYGWSPMMSRDVIGSYGDLISGLASDLYDEDIDPDYISGIIADLLMESPDNDEEVEDYLSPIMFGYPLDKSANVWAGGYSYFSTPNGTIGVGTPLSKDANMSAGIKGIVRPGTTAITGIDPAVGFDLVPANYVLYQDADSEFYGPLFAPDAVNGDPAQIWPVDLGSGLTFENPLEVVIQAFEGSFSAVRDGFTPEAALTLNFSLVPPGPVPPPNPPVAPASQLVAPLLNNFKPEYEILSLFRFVSNEPATPFSFFSYHPLTPADYAAFDGINLDVGAYDFIEDNIRLKKSPAPYFGVK